MSSQDDSLNIDELIEELAKLGDKDRKLKEIVAEYAANKNLEKLDSTKLRESLYLARNLIRILKEREI